MNNNVVRLMMRYVDKTNKKYGTILELMNEVDKLDNLFDNPTMTEKEVKLVATEWYERRCNE